MKNQNTLILNKQGCMLAQASGLTFRTGTFQMDYLLHNKKLIILDLTRIKKATYL